MTLKITQLSRGQKATVNSYGNLGDEAVVRLMSMGLTPGSVIEILGRAPFSGPIALRVGDRHLAVDGALAAAIPTVAI